MIECSLCDNEAVARVYGLFEDGDGAEVMGHYNLCNAHEAELKEHDRLSPTQSWHGLVWADRWEMIGDEQTRGE